MPPAPATESLRLAKAIKDELVSLRRDFHMHPELGFEETRTAAKVAEYLEALGLEVKTEVGKTGVVGLLRGEKRGQCVALRADMDALPVQEANDVPYRSQRDGLMHACGHDAHTAMLMGAAKVLGQLCGQVAGSVKFLFQPSEEIVSGAARMIQEGALESPKVHAAYALHVTSDMPVGTANAVAGARMAAVNHFSVKVSGKGGHGAHPCDTHDPLVAAAHICVALSALRREVYSLEPYVLSVCSVHGGSSYNIIPHEAEIKATLRTFAPKVVTFLKKRIREVAEGVARTFRTEARVSFDIHCPALVNDEKAAAIVRAAGKRVGIEMRDKDPTMGSEDFSFFADLVPSAFVRLGTQLGKKPRVGHSNTFDIDERALPLGAALLAQCALEQLGNG